MLYEKAVWVRFLLFAVNVDGATQWQRWHLSTLYDDSWILPIASTAIAVLQTMHNHLSVDGF